VPKCLFINTEFIRILDAHIKIHVLRRSIFWAALGIRTVIMSVQLFAQAFVDYEHKTY
jgi:hypothetical protein